MHGRGRRWISVGCALLFVGCAARSHRPVAPAVRLSGVDFALPSGLRVVFQADSARPLVAVATVIDAGSADDPPGKEGLAHFVEHLWFRSRPDGGARVSERLADTGAAYNAFTADDYTEFVTSAPASALQSLLDLEAERLRAPLAGITEEQFRIEREVVRNELRQRDERGAFGAAYEGVRELLFPAGHRYRRSRQSAGEALDGLTLADARAFAASHYRATGTTIMVAGDFDPTRAADLLSGTFPFELLAAPGSSREAASIQVVEPKPRLGAAPPVPDPADARPKRIRGPVLNPTVVLAWTLPGAWRGDDALVEMTADALHGAVGSLLYPEYGGTDRIEGLACDAVPGRDATVLLCRIEVVEGQDPETIATRAIGGVWELWNPRSADWREKAFVRAKQDYMRLIFDEAATLDRTVDMAAFVHYTGRADRFPRAFQDLERVTGPAARKLASRYLNRKRVVTLIIEPLAPEERLADASTLQPGSLWAGDVVDGRPAIRRDRDTIAALVRAALPPTPSDLTVRSGLRILVQHNPGPPFVRISLLTRGGFATHEPWGSLRFAWPDDRGGDALDVMGVWSRRMAADAEVRSIEAPAENLEGAITLLLRKARSTRSTFKRFYRKDLLERMERRQAALLLHPDVKAEGAILDRLLPGHPLATIRHDVEALRKVDPGDFNRWYDATLAPRNATLLVVGNVDRAQAEEAAIRAWSKWRQDDPGAPQPGLPAAPEPPAARNVVVIDAPGRSQTDVLVGCRIDAPDGREEVHAEVLADVLQHDLGSRIREAAGASYGVHVRTRFEGAGIALLRLRTTVDTAVLEPVLRTVLERYEHLSRGGIEEAALEEVLLRIARAEPLLRRSNREVTFSLVERIRRGRLVDDLGFRPRWLADTTAADLAKAINPCAGREAIVLVGPKSGIDQTLRALTLASE